jgi:hypothetical protein
MSRLSDFIFKIQDSGFGIQNAVWRRFYMRIPAHRGPAARKPARDKEMRKAAKLGTRICRHIRAQNVSFWRDLGAIWRENVVRGLAKTWEDKKKIS